MSKEFNKKIPADKFIRVLGALALVGATGSCEARSLPEPAPVERTLRDDVGDLWQMHKEDAQIAGEGEFQGWVEGKGYLDDQEIEEGYRLGRWFNNDGFGVLRFKPISE